MAFSCELQLLLMQDSHALLAPEEEMRHDAPPPPPLLLLEHARAAIATIAEPASAQIFFTFDVIDPSSNWSSWNKPSPFDEVSREDSQWGTAFAPTWCVTGGASQAMCAINRNN